MIRLSYGLSNVKRFYFMFVKFNLQVHIAPFVQNKVFARRNYVPLLDRHIYAALKHQD